MQQGERDRYKDKGDVEPRSRWSSVDGKLLETSGVRADSSKTNSIRFSLKACQGDQILREGDSQESDLGGFLLLRSRPHQKRQEPD